MCLKQQLSPQQDFSRGSVDPAPQRVGYRERVCDFRRSLHAPFVCCMSSVLSRLKKTWLQKGAEQKAKCDIRPAGNVFSQELLSAARMLLWIVRRHRGISHRREWLQDTLSNSVCGDPLGGAERISFTVRGRKSPFLSSASRPVAVFFVIVLAGQKRSFAVVFMAVVSFPLRASLRIDVPSLTPTLALRDMWAVQSFGKSCAILRCQRHKYAPRRGLFIFVFRIRLGTRS